MPKKKNFSFFLVSLCGVKDVQLKRIQKNLQTLLPQKNHISQLFNLFFLKSFAILLLLFLSIKLFRTIGISIFSNLFKLLTEKLSLFRTLLLNSLLSFISNLISNLLQQKSNNAEQPLSQISSYLSFKTELSKVFNSYTSNLLVKFTNQSH